MNYNSLINKPTLNHKELIGNNSASDIGGMTEEQFAALLETDLTPYYTKAQIDDLFSRSYMYREKSGSIVTFECPSTSQSIPEVTAEIVAVQSGSGDPSPTNVRPISGWSAVNVYRNGNNYLAKSIDLSSIDATVANCFFMKKGNYTISYTASESHRIGIRMMDSSGNLYTDVDHVPRAFWNYNSTTKSYYAGGDISSGYFSTKITLVDDCYIRFVSNKATSIFTDVMLNIGDTATTYEAFSGTTYTTTLKDVNDQPLTCYGGQLENENGVQRLTLTHGYIASYNGETLPSTWISDRDVYAEGTTPTTGAEVVYLLATPEEIPQDNLTISSQSGTNNLWADSGDVTVKALDSIIKE